MFVSNWRRQLDAVPNSRTGRLRASVAGVLVALVTVTSSGCAWDPWFIFTNPPSTPPPDSYVLRGDHLEADVPAHNEEAVGRLTTAHEYFRAGKYHEAEYVFSVIRKTKKTSPALAEEAIYYEAECLRLQGCYPKAADTYNKLLNEFPSGTYREQCIQRMFEIANFWLQDVRKQMAEEEEYREGKRWVVWPAGFHFEKEKPLLDESGRALEKLEQVRLNDMTGPYADKALFLAGGVKFFDRDYKEAEFYYSQLVEMHPNSPFAPQAIKLGIISKVLATGGTDYDARRVADARRLVDTALRGYPELASKDGKFLENQLVLITNHQAEKDFKTAEFYKRTYHPCSAYFCYEIVRRRYPGTEYAKLAAKRMEELQAQVEKEEKKKKKPASQAALDAATRPASDTPALVPSSLPDLATPGRP